MQVRNTSAARRALAAIGCAVAVVASIAPSAARAQEATTKPAAAAAAGGEANPDLALFPPLKWKSSGMLVPQPDGAPDRKIVSIKDPTIVRYEGKWLIYATTYGTAPNGRAGWNMVYLSFADWKDAKDAKPYFMDQTPGLSGYHCAPQLFYFEPQKKWYLTFQSQQPQYCTADDPTKPETWTRPKNFFPQGTGPKNRLPIDYYFISDDKNSYLFFTGDDGNLYRSSTSIDKFPEGFSDPVVVIHDARGNNLFEAGATYKIQGTDKWLTIIEAIGPGGVRFYRSWTADKLDGEWRPLADTFDKPFAGIKNVTFPEGETPWTADISHGELIRTNYNQTPTIDPKNMQFLYQGQAPEHNGVRYEQLPYRLGVLTLEGATPKAD